MLTAGASSQAWAVSRRPPSPCQPVGVHELLGRIRCLRAVHAEADQLVAPVLEYLLDHLASLGGRVLPVDVGDQPAGHTEVASADRMPSTSPATTVVYGTPRVVCSVGLKNISRYLRLPSSTPSSIDS